MPYGRLFSLLAWIIIASPFAFGDDNDSQEIQREIQAEPSEASDGSNIELEELYDKYDKEQKQQGVNKKTEDKAKEAAREKLPEVTHLSELGTLAPFTDVAVIQRRFLPRTMRFELSGSGMTVLNNPFFNNLGLGARLAFHFQEKHGIEAQYMYFTNTNRSVTNDLEEKRNVSTTNLVTTKSYLGGAYKWTPFYGKISFINREIVPFDLFFNFGFGMTKTQYRNEPTLHLGTGQSFALSKTLAVRWDLVWNYFNAEVPDLKNAGKTSTSTHSDLYLSVGLGFFFPEAKYR